MNNWIVLLTTAINNPENLIKDPDLRKVLYHTQIQKWLNETNYDIVVVESSGYNFPEIKHERLHKVIFKFDTNLSSSSQYEALSISRALKDIRNKNFYINCTHILKVTGRYFLKDITNHLNNVEQNKDLYLQKHFNNKKKCQNSEYYGIKKELYDLFIEGGVKKIGLMEDELFKFAISKSICRIGYFPNNIRRGGDNLLIENL
jgi:hypothetical protein